MTRQGTIFLKDITKLDCGVFDPSLGVIGQSWHVDLQISGAIDDQGIVFDFSPLKRLVRETLKTNIDHALVIPIQSSAVKYSESAKGELWELTAKNKKTGELEQWRYLCPTGFVFPVRAKVLNRNVIEQEVLRSLRHRLPAEVSSVKVTLRDEDLDPTEAFFRYTHSITGHQGLCQRPFHGHRSSLEVYIDDDRRPDLEHYLARDVLGSNVHIACESQLNGHQIEPGQRPESSEPITLAYEGQLGYYETTMPAHRIFVVEHETSIECLSQQLALAIRAKEPRGHIRVAVYEGIDKGGIAEL